jgi:tripartite-type tricarboxylate transporter receptor subunit TctC
MKKVFFPVLCLLLWNCSAHAQAPFYQGKTIRVIVGTPPGNLYDLWARLIVAHWGKHIPGNPEFIVQNMPGAGHVVAANHLYSVAKPDGLTLIGSIIPSLYLNQLVGRTEIQFDWAKFTWIGSPATGPSQMYMRADTPYKSIEDVRAAKEPPKCGATGVTGPDSYLPKLLQEVVGAKFNIVTRHGARKGLSEISFRRETNETQNCLIRRPWRRSWTNTKLQMQAGVSPRCCSPPATWDDRCSALRAFRRTA